MNYKSKEDELMNYIYIIFSSPSSIGSSIMPGLSSPPVTSASHGGIGPGIPPPHSAPFSPQHIAGFSPPSLFSR